MIQWAIALFFVLAGISTSAAEVQSPAPLTLVADGKPLAEIVVAERRPRMTTLAALELRQMIHRVSGVRLPIVIKPSADPRVRVYVGRSEHTERLGITDDGLRYGAYRIASGPQWLALVGTDTDFDPSRYPWPLKRNDVPRVTELWQTAIKGRSDAPWGFPFDSGFKGFWNPKDFNEQLAGTYGDDAPALWKAAGGGNGFWNQDQSGSFNAVCALTQSLGVRWYMEGDLGLVVPKLPVVRIEPANQTVKPDFPLRKWQWYNYASFSFDSVLWARRLGMNSGHEVLGPCTGPHGLTAVHEHAAMKSAHPDYYALLNGKRDTEHRDRGTPCFTSAGLAATTAAYIRFLYNTYDLPSVDIWPVDGLRNCQCDTCKDKSASELVWGFADRVARDVYKSHPDRRVTCGAYTSYRDPPTSIEKFSPNLGVWLSNTGRPLMLDPEHWAEYQALVTKWQSKIAPGNLIRLENNRYHIWGEGKPIAYPVIHPRGVARDLKSLKGISLGDSGEQSQSDGVWRVPAIEHITLYVQARFLWNADQDVEALLDEYCAKFYGSAAAPMKAAIAFAEDNLAYKDQSRNGGRANPANVSPAVAVRLRELLEVAAAAAPGDSVYGQRVRAVIGSLEPKADLIARARKQQESLDDVRAKAPLVLAAADLARSASYELKDNATGKPAEVKTTFRVAWADDAITIDIRCAEPAMDKLKMDKDVLAVDRVVLLIETPLHAHYQLAISPDGQMIDGNPGPSWRSLAEVKPYRGADHWGLTVRIPVVGQAEAQSDPKHRIAGLRPTGVAPWHINVARHRLVDLQAPQTQAFSPSRAALNMRERFARLQAE